VATRISTQCVTRANFGTVRAIHRLGDDGELRMDVSGIVDYINAFPGVESTTDYGYTFFFYRSERNLPFATLIDADYEYDEISNLSRPGVYRLNIGISRETFQWLFGTTKVDVSRYDFTALDTIMPHPEYAKQNFVCVLSPERTFEKVQGLLTEAHEIAVRRYARRNTPRGDSDPDTEHD
jgi:hypothetical protein